MSTQEQAVCEDERIRAGTPLRRARGSSVAIVYRFLPRWRVDFFNQLRGLLGERGIELQLLYGRDTNKVPARHRRHKWGDEVDLDWAKPVRNRILSYRGYELIWQDLPSNVYENELIILMQENCIVSNHWATLRAKMRGTKIALWGHGLNLQAPSGSLGNRIKQLYSTRVDWWFAYTNSVAEQVSRMGFARDRITVVQNAIDTNFLRAEIDRTETSTLAHIRRELKLGGGPVGIFCGAMYHLKRLSFLTEACLELRRRLPRFGMIFLGEGPDLTIVKAFCDNHTWAHYLGPKHGAARVPYFKLADIFLMPGLVGLCGSRQLRSRNADDYNRLSLPQPRDRVPPRRRERHPDRKFDCCFCRRGARHARGWSSPKKADRGRTFKCAPVYGQKYGAAICRWS